MIIVIVDDFSVSLDLLAADIRVLLKGMKDATGELVNNKQNEALKEFCLEAEPKITKLQGDLETAKVLLSFLCLRTLCVGVWC